MFAKLTCYRACLIPKYLAENENIAYLSRRTYGNVFNYEGVTYDLVAHNYDIAKDKVEAIFSKDKFILIKLARTTKEE